MGRQHQEEPNHPLRLSKGDTIIIQDDRGYWECTIKNVEASGGTTMEGDAPLDIQLTTDAKYLGKHSVYGRPTAAQLKEHFMKHSGGLRLSE